MYQPNRADMQRYIDEMMRYRSRRTVNNSYDESMSKNKAGTTQDNYAVPIQQSNMQGVGQTRNNSSYSDRQMTNMQKSDTLERQPQVSPIFQGEQNIQNFQQAQEYSQSQYNSSLQENSRQEYSELQGNRGQQDYGQQQEYTMPQGNMQNMQPQTEMPQYGTMPRPEIPMTDVTGNYNTTYDDTFELSGNTSNSNLQAEYNIQEEESNIENQQERRPFYPTPLPPLDSIMPDEREEEQPDDLNGFYRPSRLGRTENERQLGNNPDITPMRQSGTPPNILPQSSGNIEITGDNDDSTTNLQDIYDNYADIFPQKGYIIVQALTARRTFPLQNAIVEISKDFIQGRYVISTQLTDESGKIQQVEVPAVRKEFSSEPGNVHPYTTYTVTVKHPEYMTMTYEDVPVFEGVTSWQTADMIPLSLTNGYSDEVSFAEDSTYDL